MMVRAKDPKTALFQVSEVLIIINNFPILLLSVHFYPSLEPTGTFGGPARHLCESDHGNEQWYRHTDEDDPVRQGAA